ncbi:MAG: hypothetical protein HOK71_02780 [Planctomycetaceae bacterium]|jgi:type II secretory pathway component PulF|nr:hypothetical protein [Planctomycetaceae bacterium]MBT6483583.1 hypothetical protein [Planctomycetaceae bacterium]
MSFFYQFLMMFDVLGWMHRARAARQSALLSVLAIATEKQLPLTPILDAFADDSRLGWRHQVHDLSDMLQAGTSLPDAIEAVHGLLPPDVVMAARVGAESGTLAAALKMAAERLAPRDTTTVSSPASIVVYLMFVTVVMLGIVAFIMVYIVPKFKRIFEDFGTELPSMTIFVIDASHFAATYGLLLIPFIFGVVWVAMVYAVAAGRPTVPMTGPFKLLTIMMPRIATGGVLRSLSIAVAAGRPLIGALSTMAGVHPAPAIRRRIGDIADEVEQGHNCWQAMLASGLISRRETALLSAAERAGNLDWALRRTADNVDSRISFRFNALVEFVRPVLMLLYAGVVGTVVVGLFMPLVKLLNDLS